MESLEMIAESQILSELEQITRCEDKLKIIEPERFAKLDLQYRVKIKWISNGDENFGFFHGTLKHKNRKNKIHGLNINNDWTSDPKAIK